MRHNEMVILHSLPKTVGSGGLVLFGMLHSRITSAEVYIFINNNGAGIVLHIAELTKSKSPYVDTEVL